MIRSFLFVLSALLLLPNFLHSDLQSNLPYDQLEKFDPSLLYLNSIPALESHIDSIVAEKQLAPQSFDQVLTIANVVKYRFYHGFSHLSLHENWMAALAGKWIKPDHACKVFPNQILQHANAACSQQEIVMMEVLRRKKIKYRPVFFPHHYALEVFVEGKWYYFDPNMEPQIKREERALEYWNHHADSLKRHYDTRRFNNLDYQFGKNFTATNGEENEVPAPNARLFHTITAILSKTLWLLPLLLAIFWPRFFGRKTKQSH